MMRVLFISRAKQNNIPSPVTQAQADSLIGQVKLAIYLFRGKGWSAYLHNIFKLRKHLKSNKADLIHAHYSYVGIVASLATRKPIIVSLMGSDIEDYRIGRILIRIFNRLSWNAVIVKSQPSKDKIKLKNAYVVPNGVNLEVFEPSDYAGTRTKVGFETNKKYVLFLADPARHEKNFALANAACEIVKHETAAELLVLHDVPHKEVPDYLSAADVLLLTSYFEGSPNAIKEAMACNCPIVSTDVGDVKGVIGDTEECYITTFEPEDVAAKLKLALEFGKRTNGREKIRYLDDKIIAEKLVEIYKSVLK